MSKPFFSRDWLRCLGAVLVLACLVPSLASAQYFGRNRVRYERFDWRILKTEHFDIYYYPEEEKPVRDAARMAERWYQRLSSVFNREFTERKSIILYADQSDFQQTTLSSGAIGEGTGGFTESLRTRVVLPLTGNYEDTDHVLGHELVHVFQYDILREPRGGGRSSGGGAGLNLPLWFIEGLAEYLSLGRQDPQTAMYLREALVRDELPDLRKLSRRGYEYFPYRWGHAFWAYVGGRWGDDIVSTLFVRGTQVGAETAIQEVLGMSDKDFSAAWQASIRQDYAPVLAARQAPTTAGQQVLPREREESRAYYVAPVLNPAGDQFIVYSTRGLFSFDLYLADARTGDIREKVVSENADPHLDSLRFLDSAGSWSPDGSRFAFIVAARGDNELAIVDVASRRIAQRIPVQGVGQMWNTSWSPDGRTIAFAGSSGGITDLYLYDIQGNQTRKLTNDVYADLQPEWSPDGRTIAFISDRGRGTDLSNLSFGPMGIWFLDVASGQVRQALPDFTGNQINPKFGPGGRDLYFLSDVAGVSDIYRVALGEGLTAGGISRVTRLSTGVGGIARLSPALSVAERTGQVMFTVFRDATYHVYSLTAEQARGEPLTAPGTTAQALQAATLPPLQSRSASLVERYLQGSAPIQDAQASPSPSGRQMSAFETAEYRPRLQLDFLGPAAGVAVSSLGYGFAGDVTAIFGDVLGQRELGVSIQGASTSDFNEVGAQAYYLNQAGRWQVGVSGGHIPYISAFTTVSTGTVEVDGQPVLADLVEQVRQTVTQDELSLIAHYPFSTTQRFEAAAGILHLGYDVEVRRALVSGNTVIDRDEQDLPAPESLNLYQGSLAFVGDSSIFGFTSPIQGRRYRIEVQPTFGDLNFEAVTADFRQYVLLRPVTLAFRGLHFGRYGTDGESPRLAPLYVGRPTLVRGYEVGDIDLSECTSTAGSDECPEFDRLVGSRIGVANFEVRVPLFGVPGYGIFRTSFLPIELAGFVDAGVAWTKDDTPDLRFEERSTERVPVVSAGVSARVLLGGFAVLEFYYAKPFQRPDAGMVTGFLISPGW